MISKAFKALIVSGGLLLAQKEAPKKAGQEIHLVDISSRPLDLVKSYNEVVTNARAYADLKNVLGKEHDYQPSPGATDRDILKAIESKAAQLGSAIRQEFIKHSKDVPLPTGASQELSLPPRLRFYDRLMGNVDYIQRKAHTTMQVYGVSHQEPK